MIKDILINEIKKRLVLTILMLVIFSSFAFANTLTVGDTWSASSPSSYAYGVRCEVLQDIDITQLDFEDTNANSCGIVLVSDDSSIATGIMTAGVCTISASLTASTEYRFVENEDLASVDNGPNDATPNFPVADAYISCTIGTYYGSSWEENAGYIWSLKTITYNTGSAQPTLILDTNLVNNTNNSNTNPLTFTYNGTIADGITDIFNISFYQNGVFNQTLLDINLSLNNLYNITLPTNLEGYYNISFNASNFEANDTSGVYIYLIDLLQPNILTNITNNSIYYKYQDNLNIYFNSSDNNLYAMNFTIFELNSDGSINQTINNTFKTDINTTTNTITYFNNLTNYNLSRYRLDLTSWDSHTAIDVNTMVWYWDNNKLYIEGLTFEGNDIKELNNQDELVTYFYKDFDRYKLKVTFEDQSLSHEFILTAPNWEYVGDLYGYKGHFVTLEDGGKWLDFEGNNVKSITITDLGNDKYLIKTDHYYLTDEVEYESIGDLNENSRSYYFNVTEGFYIYAYHIEDNTTVSEFTVNALGLNNLTRSTTTGKAYFNQSSGVYNLTITSTAYLDFTINNITFSQQSNYTAYMNLSNAFRVYIRNQLDNILIDDRTVWLEFIGTNSSNYSTTTATKFITDLAPDNYIIRYSAVNYSNAFYYFTLTNNTNTKFTIYMLPDSSTDNVTARVIDEISKKVIGAFIHVQRYDLNTNTYRTVEILQTNFEGETILHVTKNTEFYKFLVYYEGDLKLETAPTYIYEDDITLQIQTAEDIASRFFTTQGINWDLSYNLATGNFNFDYSDATNTITSGSLYLYNVSSGGQTLYNSNSVSSASATILLNAPNISGYTYLAKAYVTIDGLDVYLGELYYSYPSEVAPDDNSKLFWIFILMVLFATLGFWDLSIAIILTPIPLLVASAIKFIPLPLYATIPIEIIAIIIVVIINKRG